MNISLNQCLYGAPFPRSYGLKVTGLFSLLLVLAFMLSGHTLLAQNNSPVGLWQLFDDDTKAPLTHVLISDEGGVLTGKMVKLLDPKRQDARCHESCPDERKGQPMLGLKILRNVKATGDGEWSGGDILDPNNGKIYRVRLRPMDGGKTLEVRGYIGPFFRNQQWLRIDSKTSDQKT